MTDDELRRRVSDALGQVNSARQELHAIEDPSVRRPLERLADAVETLARAVGDRRYTS